jgi:hypothetical protein
MAVNEGMDIHGALLEAVHSRAPLSDLRSLVRDELAADIPRKEVLEQLEALRQELREAGEESQEDVVLDVMDFVTGWASPHMRI